MKSWMSTRRPACAPPPKIWICGSGSSVGVGAAEIALQRLAGAPRRRRARPPSTPRASRCRRGATCSACRRARSARRSSAAWSAASRPATRARRSRRSRGRPRASRRSRRTRAPPSRRSSASPRAGGGAGRRDGAADARRLRAATSASTVGRPRLSQTRRPCTKAIAGVGHAASSSVQARRTSPSASTGSREQRARDAPHPVPVVPRR